MSNPNLSINKCPECLKVFTRSSHLKRHLKNIHKISSKPTTVKQEETVNEVYLTSEQCIEEVDSEMCENAKLEVSETDNLDNAESIVKYEPQDNSDAESLLEPNTADDNGNVEQEDDEDYEVLDQNGETEEELEEEEEVQTKTEDTKENKQIEVSVSPKSSVKKKYTKKGVDKNTRHECEQCQKTFSRATHLKRHMVTHFGIRNYNCDVCNKAFARLDHLKNHILSHADKRPFECTECTKTFARGEQLRKHKETRHSDRPRAELKTVICEICNKGFTTTKYLQVSFD
jgi:hypothetical protein